MITIIQSTCMCHICDAVTSRNQATNFSSSTNKTKKDRACGYKSNIQAL